LKKEIIEDTDTKSGISGKIFTARFIETMHVGIGMVGFILMFRRIFLN
jgi:hypothetical protein